MTPPRARCRRAGAIGLAVWLALGACTPARADPTDPLAALRWQARALLLFAPAADAPEVTALLAQIEQQADAFAERRLRLVELYPPPAGAAGTPAPTRAGPDAHALPLSAAEVSALRTAFAPLPAPATLVLIGLDGGEKLRLPAKRGLAPVFAAIDRMPMRQRELRATGAGD